LLIEAWDGPSCEAIVFLRDINKKTAVTHNAVLSLDCLAAPPLVYFDVVGPTYDLVLCMHVLSEPTAESTVRTILASGQQKLILHHSNIVSLTATVGTQGAEAAGSAPPAMNATIHISPVNVATQLSDDTLIVPALAFMEPPSPECTMNDLFVTIEVCT